MTYSQAFLGTYEPNEEDTIVQKDINAVDCSGERGKSILSG